MDLNELLKDKAENQLNEEIEKFISDFRAHKFFYTLSGLTIKLEKEEISLDRFIYPKSRQLIKTIKDDLLDDYIEEFSTEFIQKVESISQDLDELKNTKQTPV